MSRLSSSLLIASQLLAVSASPASPPASSVPSVVCGPPNSNGKGGICVDYNAVTSKPYAEYQEDHTDYLFDECKAACEASAECETFLYYTQAAGLENFDAWTCELLSVRVNSYLIPGGQGVYGAGATQYAQDNSFISQAYNPASQNVSALSNYFDKRCSLSALPIRKFDGQITTNGSELICGYGSLRSPTQQSYADLFKPTPNLNQTACRDLCQNTETCKSNFWQMYASPSKKAFNGSVMNEPFINDGDCALFTQPVSEHGTFFEFDFQLFDVNCPIGRGT